MPAIYYCKLQGRGAHSCGFEIQFHRICEIHGPLTEVQNLFVKGHMLDLVFRSTELYWVEAYILCIKNQQTHITVSTSLILSR